MTSLRLSHCPVTVPDEAPLPGPHGPPASFIKVGATLDCKPVLPTGLERRSVLQDKGNERDFSNKGLGRNKVVPIL